MIRNAVLALVGAFVALGTMQSTPAVAQQSRIAPDALVGYDAARGLRSLGLNAFGGQALWIGGLEEECPTMLGNTAALFGEISLSCYTGGTPGLVAAHLIYETK